MFRLDFGSTRQYCDGVTRRSFLQLGVAGMAAVGLPQLLPAYVAVPSAASIGLTPGYFGAHMLGAQYNPFQVGSDPGAPQFTVPNLNLAQGLSIPRLEDRRTLVRHFDTSRRQFDATTAAQ